MRAGVLNNCLLTLMCCGALFSACSKPQSASGDSTLSEDVNDTGYLALKSADERQQLSAEEYMRYISDPVNGLISSKELKNLEFSAFYQPASYLAVRNSGRAGITKESYRKELNELGELQYFGFKITAKNFSGELMQFNLSSMEEYEARVNYFAFKMQEDLKLIEGIDTLDCVMFHFERNYGVAPNASFVLAFPESKNNDKIYDKTLSYNERIFGVGKINLTIDKRNIVNIPELKIEENEKR